MVPEDHIDNNGDELFLSSTTPAICEEESISRDVFFDLDPVIRALLVLIQAYRTAVANPTSTDTGTLALSVPRNKLGSHETAANDDTTSSSTSSSNSRTLVGLLQTQSTLLDQLQRKLEGLRTSSYIDYNIAQYVQRDDNSHNKLGPSLVILSDYVLLPLLAIVRGYSIEYSIFVSSSSTIHSRGYINCYTEQTLVHQSATCQCVERAVRGISIWAHLVTQQLQHQQPDQYIQGGLSIKQNRQILNSCAVALPSGQYWMELKSMTHGQKMSSNVLDHGELCVQSILETIMCILLRIGHPLEGSDDRGTLVSDNESSVQPWMMRVVDCCVGIVEPIPPPTPQSCSVDTQSSTVVNRSNNYCDLLMLQPVALKTLQAIIKVGGSFDGWWKQIFPGLYIGLYRCLLSSMRLTIGQSTLLVRESARTLRYLLSWVLQTPKAVDENDEIFHGPVNQRVPSTLVLLVNTLTNARISHIRCEAIELDRILVIDTLRFWEPHNRDILMNSALESVLVLNSDEDTIVASEAKQALADISSFQPEVNSIIVSRAIQLLDEFMVLARSSQRDQLKQQLKLISCFISAIMASTLCTRSFRAAFSVDHFAISTYKALIEAQNSEKESQNDPHVDLSNEVQSVVSKLSTLLPAKELVLLVDMAVTDLYQSCLMVRKGTSTLPSRHRHILSEWAGSLRIANALLSAGFGAVHLASKKHRTLLSALARSILPILTSHALWEYPILTENDSQYMMELITFVGCIMLLLDEDGKRLNTVILYPLLEKASSTSSSQIHNVATSILNNVARKQGLKNSSTLLLENVSALSAALSARLRVPGGRTLGPSQIGGVVLEVARVSAIVFRITRLDSSSSLLDGTDHEGKSLLFHLEGVVHTLLSRFDLASATTSISQDEATVLVFLDLFESVSLHLLRAYGVSTSLGEHDLEKNSQPWLKILEPFRNVHRADEHEKVTKLAEISNRLLESSFVRIDTTLAADFITRSCFLLSHPSLMIQLQSCKVLKALFQFLGWVASNVTSADMDNNGSKNAVLRQIHKIWPLISSRLDSAVHSLTASENVSLLVMKHHRPTAATPSAEQQSIFLAGLLDLISVMTLCSSDFMVTRIREKVWPRMSETLAKFSKHGVQFGRQPDVLLAIMEFVRRVYAHHPTAVVLVGLIPSVGVPILDCLESDNDRIVEVCMSTLKTMLQVDCDSLLRHLMTMAGHQLHHCPLPLQNCHDAKVSHDRHADSAASIVVVHGNMTVSASASRRAIRAQLLLDYISQLPEQSIF